MLLSLAITHDKSQAELLKLIETFDSSEVKDKEEPKKEEPTKEEPTKEEPPKEQVKRELKTL